MAQLSENKQRMQNGEMYHCFTAELVNERSRAVKARDALNDNRDPTRRTVVKLWRDLILDTRPMPPVLPDPDDDAAQFHTTDPWVDGPTFCDYGYNIKIAPTAYLNKNATFIDTCPIYIGARTLIGPSCHFYSGGHPLDPAVRNGIEGPEFGGVIDIGEDCWLGGNVTVLPNVKIGRGSTVGAGSVVTKSVPPFHVVAGNPARILKKIESELDPDYTGPRKTKDPTASSGPTIFGSKASKTGVGEPMAKQAEVLEKLEQKLGDGQ